MNSHIRKIDFRDFSSKMILDDEQSEAGEKQKPTLLSDSITETKSTVKSKDEKPMSL